MTCQHLLLLGIYQPISNGRVIPGVIAVGTVGVWHLLCSDFTTAQQEILAKMKDCAWNIQPEKENFILTELSIGTYLATPITCSVYLTYPACLICRQDIVFEDSDRL